MAAMQEQSTKNAVGRASAPPSAFCGVIDAKALPCRVGVPGRLFFHSGRGAPQHRHHGYRGWCGSYLSKYLGKPDRRLALAHSWASEGMNAGGPGIGVVVVWSHHVGIITGQTPDGHGSFIAATMAARFVREPDRSPARLHSGACRKWIALSLCSIPLLATASDVIERPRQRTCFEELGDCTQGPILGCHGGET